MDSVVNNKIYYTRVPANYPNDGECFEVVWDGIFMPFDIIKGLDSCPPDNCNYKRNKKNHWWVCPKTKKDICNIHDISFFLDMPDAKEFSTLEKAVKYCLKWRKEWFKNQLKIKCVIDDK